jgi:hypothetical protein
MMDRTGKQGDGRLAYSTVEVDECVQGDLDALEEFAQELAQLRSRSAVGTEVREKPSVRGGPGDQVPLTSGRINVDPEAVEQSLAKLVLTLIELLRRLLERQAMRRMEAGSLTDDEIERLGETFLKLEQKMEELKVAFDLQDEELNLCLGPLGNLLPEE